MAKRVIIRASDVAAIIGRNSYKSYEEVFNEYWKRYSPSTFTGVLKKEKAEKVLEVSKSAQEALGTALEKNCKSSAVVQEVVSDAVSKVQRDESLTEEQKSDVINHIRTTVYTNYGTKSEAKTADKVSVKENVKLSSDDTYYNMQLCVVKKCYFVLCGRVDRIDRETNTLIEIKNRVNQLFGRVVDYENVQVQVYLKLTGLENARLLEQYEDEIASYDINRDDDMWENEILPSILSFCFELCKIM